MTQKAIKETLSSIFGEEKYEISFPAKESFSLIILFPYVTIKNESGEQHLIKDLYIKLEGNRGSRINMYGLRGYLSYGEFLSGYNHSHLQSGNRDYFNSFCLGTSELTMLLHEDIFQSEEYLRYFCIVLENYLSWESIEGTPYIRINTISPFGRLNNPYYNDHWLKNLKLGIKLDVNINFTIKNTLDIENAIYKELQEVGAYYREQGTVNKIGNIYYSQNQGRDTTSWQNRKLFDFNGKEIKLQIEEFKSENNEKITKTVHPEITQVWCRRASKAIRDKYYSDNRIPAEASIIN